MTQQSLLNMLFINQNQNFRPKNVGQTPYLNQRQNRYFP